MSVSSVLNRFALAAAILAAASAQAASLSASGYNQSFDSMGQSASVPPEGWAMYTGPSGTSNSTWVAAIPAAGVAAMIPTAGGLVPTSSPSGTNNNGFNAALSASAADDRVLATSPTSISGGAIQLTLTNDTGTSLSALSVSFDTVRFTSVGTANQLPGYWLFFSLDGANWTNVASLNPSIASVPNTVGVTGTVGSFSLGASVASGANVWMRWVDDNAQETSPDQIIGLNNLSVTAVPEPAVWSLLLAGLAACTRMSVRRRAS